MIEKFRKSSYGETEYAALLANLSNADSLPNLIVAKYVRMVLVDIH